MSIACRKSTRSINRRRTQQRSFAIRPTSSQRNDTTTQSKLRHSDVAISFLIEGRNCQTHRRPQLPRAMSGGSRVVIRAAALVYSGLMRSAVWQHSHGRNRRRIWRGSLRAARWGERIRPSDECVTALARPREKSPPECVEWGRLERVFSPPLPPVALRSPVLQLFTAVGCHEARQARLVAAPWPARASSASRPRFSDTRS